MDDLFILNKVLRTEFKTITADNGTEFHQYLKIEKVSPVKLYFSNPYYSWGIGSNENVNGLIRQHLPKRTSMHTLTQVQRDTMARKLNENTGKRHNYKTPEELFYA